MYFEGLNFSFNASYNSECGDRIDKESCKFCVSRINKTELWKRMKYKQMADVFC